MEVKGGILSELLRAVLCSTVVHNGMHTDMSSYVQFGLDYRPSFLCVFKFSLYFACFCCKGLVCILVYFRVSLDQLISVWFCLVSFVGFGDSFSTKIQEICWEERLRNYLFCVERNEMPCSIHPSSCSSRIRHRQILSRSSVCRVHFVAVDLT